MSVEAPDGVGFQVDTTLSGVGNFISKFPVEIYKFWHALDVDNLLPSFVRSVRHASNRSGNFPNHCRGQSPAFDA